MSRPVWVLMEHTGFYRSEPRGVTVNEGEAKAWRDKSPSFSTIQFVLFGEDAATKSAAWNQGYWWAQGTEATIMHNPYPNGSQRWRDWHEGFLHYSKGGE